MGLCYECFSTIDKQLSVLGYLATLYQTSYLSTLAHMQILYPYLQLNRGNICFLDYNIELILKIFCHCLAMHVFPKRLCMAKDRIFFTRTLPKRAFYKGSRKSGSYSILRKHMLPPSGVDNVISYTLSIIVNFVYDHYIS